jgi:hypothetical protein
LHQSRYFDQRTTAIFPKGRSWAFEEIAAKGALSIRTGHLAELQYPGDKWNLESWDVNAPACNRQETEF